MSIRDYLLKREKRIHVYQQLENSDCGQTCIKIVAHYYGIKLSNSDLREITDANRIGMSALDISESFHKIGLESATLKIGTEYLYKMPLPAIVYWNQNHFIVLHKVDRKGNFHIIDPARGKLKINKDEFMNSFAGDGEYGIVILVDEPESGNSSECQYKKFSSNRDDKNKPGLWSLMKSSWFDHKKSYALILGLTFIGMLADICIPFIFQNTIDKGIGEHNISLIWTLILSQFLIFLGSYVANCIVELSLGKLALSIGIDLLNRYLNKLISLPISFFSRKVGADFIQKIEDHNRIQNFLINLPGTVIFSVINLAVFTSLLIYFSPTIFLIFIIGTTISFVWSYIFLRARKELDSSRNILMSKNRNNLYELIGGISEIKANNAHKIRVSRWNSIQSKYNNLAFKASLVEFYQNGGSTVFTRIRDIIITGFCATFVVQGNMTIGLMMTVSYIVGRLAIPFNTLIASFNSAQDASISYDRIDEIMSCEIEDGIYDIEDIPDKIEFKDVSFKYPGAGNPNVIHNLSVEIKKRTITAIVGKSGCGKSTLIKLILGFYKPSEGSVMVDDIDLVNIKSNSLASVIGVVMQNGTIFSDSVKANIALSDDNPDEERLFMAIQTAALTQFVDKLPMGINTRIGESGLELSGGERQRILIARAIYKSPDILILDEATSSLDAITEKQIMNEIFELYKDKTLIVVAHRLSTIQDADNILVMNEGTVVEQGDHSELICLNGIYAALIKNQICNKTANT